MECHVSAVERAARSQRRLTHIVGSEGGGQPFTEETRRLRLGLTRNPGRPQEFVAGPVGDLDSAVILYIVEPQHAVIARRVPDRTVLRDRQPSEDAHQPPDPVADERVTIRLHRVAPWTRISTIVRWFGCSRPAPPRRLS
ncbi:hypothetical protein BJF78_13760 [Pseudonocardia sp. CNS-139]|nr:hypothetical protein BJF78_13760 [Pseudonocardia sp. CNS-139]